MHRSVIRFVARELARAKIGPGHKVLDVGSYDVNGSLRDVVGAAGAEYRGLDARPCAHARCAATGVPCVDIVADATSATALSSLFEQWDCVTCCGTIEHIQCWQDVTDNLRRMAKPGGLILVTAPGPGFPFHAHPHDYWRFTPDVLSAAFADCNPTVVPDPQSSGVMLTGRRPQDRLEAIPRVGAIPI
jgi:SAM-dependent methyltransferase